MGGCGRGEEGVTGKAGETAAWVWDSRPALCFGCPWGVLSLNDLFLFYLNGAPLTPDRLALAYGLAPSQMRIFENALVLYPRAPRAPSSSTDTLKVWNL